MSKLTPPRGYAVKDTERRKDWLSQRTGFTIPPFRLEDPENLKGLIENHVGFLALPISVAGPLLIKGDYAEGEFFVPLCTLEGTVSLSMTRGFFLSYVSGGITTSHIKQEIGRSPIFALKSLHESRWFMRWIERNYDEIKTIAESTTNHGKLIRIDKYPVHDRVILEFVYETGEAAGQNMVTIATDRACRFIHKRISAECDCRYLLESNFSGDKNPAERALLNGRGHQVIASFKAEDRILRKVLRTGVDDFMRAVIDKQLGSQMAGVLGFNMHTANALAAIYLATGQDVACVAENAVSIVTYERCETGLHVSMTMPSVTVGTVGGATRLYQQHSNLELLGCTGKDSSKKLAEIICASALALEVSLAGAIISNEFAESHSEFGRH